MSSTTIRTTCLALALLTAAGIAQERTRDKKPPTFKELHTSIQVHWDAGSFGKAMTANQQLSALIVSKRSANILAALPAAPAPYEIVPQKKQDANPFAGALAASVGSVITQKYRSDRGRLTITVTADSPMVAMAGMMFNNPAMLGPDAELIKYKECNAILSKEGRSWTLKFLIDKTMVDFDLGKESDEFGLKMFDQEAVTKLHRAIVN